MDGLKENWIDLMNHYSDCAIYNEPALPRGECDCGGPKLADDASHGPIISAITDPGSGGDSVGNVGTACLVQSQELPTDGLVADASSTHLPNAHDGISLLCITNGVDFDRA